MKNYIKYRPCGNLLSMLRDGNALDILDKDGMLKFYFPTSKSCNRKKIQHKKK